MVDERMYDGGQWRMAYGGCMMKGDGDQRLEAGGWMMEDDG